MSATRFGNAFEVNLEPPSEHQVLVFFAAFALILVVARALGAVARRFGQPAVIGELSAGLVLGPSLLGRVAPDATDWLFPDDSAQTAMLFTVGWLGVMFLLVSTGFETDLGLIRRLGSAAATVSIGSLVVPLIIGFGAGWFMPSVFLGDDTERYVYALFIAAALSISSLPVIAKILSEMGLMRRNFGQLTLAAGMVNDVIGWIMLGFVAGLARGGLKVDKLAVTLIGLVVFFAFAFTLGQKAVDASLRQIRRTGDDAGRRLFVVVTTALAFGVVTQMLHVEALLGAFVAGIVLTRSRFADHSLIAPLETVTVSVLAPVFFATAGLRIDLGLLLEAETLLWGGIVIAAASVSKFVGSLIGGRLGSLSRKESAALGVGLNARGALEIVIATVGLSLGVLNERSYTVIVLMAMATSMAAPPMLRAMLRDFEGTPEERERLDREAVLATNDIVTNDRVLIPTRGGVASLLAAQVTGLAWPDDAPVTLATVGDEAIDLRPFHAVLDGREVEHVRLDPHDDGPAAALLEQARLGYSCIVVGSTTDTRTEDMAAGDTPADDSPATEVSCFVDALLLRSPVPVVVTRMPVGSRRLPWAFANAVVPVNGAPRSRPAVEVAGHLSARIGTQLNLLYVDTEHADAGRSVRQDAKSRNTLDRISARLGRIGANHNTHIERSASAGRAVAGVVAELGADLVVASTGQRGHDGHLHLGSTVHELLDDTAVTLMLVVVPETSDADHGTASSGAESNSAGSTSAGRDGAGPDASTAPDGGSGGGDGDTPDNDDRSDSALPV